jgi:hypothetical protein
MTVSSTTNRQQYATDGVTTAFTIHFPFFNDTDVNAAFVDAAGHATSLALNADYTVSGGAGSGGALVTTAPPASGGTLTIYREIPFTQEDDYVEDDPLPADTLEGGFDRAVMRDLQLKDAQDRALTFPPTIPAGVSALLPNPGADQFLGWNALANALENKNVPGGTAVYSSLANTNAGIAQSEAVTPFGLANSNLAVSAAATATLAGVLATLLGIYFSGFALANNAADAAHDIDVGIGYARDGAANFNWITTATIVKQTDVAFAEYVASGTPSGGMDSATPLSSTPGVTPTIHVFMIGGPTKNTQPFFSTSIAPNLPSGFTRKVYVNSLLWDGSAIRPFKQRGRDEIHLVTPVQQSAAAVGTSTRTYTLSAFPTGLELMAYLGVGVVAAGGVNANHAFSALDATDIDPNTAGSIGAVPLLMVATTAAPDTGLGYIKTNASGQIRARASASHASNLEYVAAVGWRVMR